MIPLRYINEWRTRVPWQEDVQIEQDLVICRALVEIFNNPFLKKSVAFRGGTALHKLFLSPQPRYSEDIDLVQVNTGSIGEVLDNIRQALSFLGKPQVKSGEKMVTMRFKFDSEIEPIIPLKLKVETNCREHFTELGFIEKPFSVQSGWFTGECSIVTYQLEELLGTKLRALYQRKKGRDLFDLYEAYSLVKPDADKLIRCYRKYMAFVVDKPPSQAEFLQNMDAKMNDDLFLEDISGLISTYYKYDVHKAYEIVKKWLLLKL
jgi:predicted nucleotidyltransferase component of viral defense system